MMRYPLDAPESLRSGRTSRFLQAVSMAALIFGCPAPPRAGAEEPAGPDSAHRGRLYVAVPGIRNYLEYGGHGLLVYDIDHGHRLIKRIPTAGLNAKGVPNNVKGICASAATKRLYISTIEQLMCLDLVTEKLLWERRYEGGCDRMSITPDGRLIFLPSLEGAFWNVVRGEDGEIRGADRRQLGLAQHDRRPEGRRGVSGGAALAPPGGGEHPRRARSSGPSGRSPRASGRSRSTAARRSAS